MNTGSNWGLMTFNREVLDKIHSATLDVLESTGVRVDSDKAFGFLEKGGCLTMISVSLNNNGDPPACIYKDRNHN